MKIIRLGLIVVAIGGVLQVDRAGSDETTCVQAAHLSVEDCDAFPTDGQPDTAGINSAILKVHQFGGGRVVFPPGDYEASGIQHKSHVELYSDGGAKIIRSGNEPVIVSDPAEVSGSIAKDSSVLTVDNGAAFEVGARVAVRGAGGRSTVQQRPLALAVLTETSPFVLQAGTHGWATNPANDGYLIVENEIIRYGPAQ